MKKFFSVILSLALVFSIPTLSFGDNNGNGNGATQDHTCQGGHNCNGEGSGGSVTSANTNRNNNTNRNRNTNRNNNTANGGNASNELSNTISNVVSGGGGSSDGGSSYEEGDYYAYSAPSLSPAVGTETSQLGTIFGSVSVANTEDYVKSSAQSKVLIDLHKAGLVDTYEAKAWATKVLVNVDDASKPKRILGVGPKTRGKHLFNLFGVLATDSWRDGTDSE